MRYNERLLLGFLVAFVLSVVAVGASTAMAEVGPYATVYNSKGEAVGRWGAAYGAEPGTQIQLAENFAECGKITACSTFPEKPMYPKVSLEPGVYHLLTAYGSKYPVGGPEQKVGPWCEGIFAYSGVTLEGSSASGGSVIGNDITAAKPCSANPGLRWLSSVVYVGANQERISVTGKALKISSLVIQSDPPSESGPRAEYGLFAGNIQGPNLSVVGVTEAEAENSGLLIGNEQYPVIGTESSPVQVINNKVEDSHNEGILLEGKYMTVADNTVTESWAHGIAAFGPSSESIDIENNTIVSSSWGVSLDGSESSTSIGRNDSVYGNTIEDTCVGTILYRQVDARVAGNYVVDPYTGWKPSKGTQGCPDFGTSVGVEVLNSCVNGVWSNRLFNFQEGVWIYDGGDAPSPCEGRTHANYIGRVLEVGKPWPWTMAGNWLERPELGFVASSYDDRPSAVSGNEFADNAIDNAESWWYFEPGASEITYENT